MQGLNPRNVMPYGSPRTSTAAKQLSTSTPLHIHSMDTKSIFPRRSRYYNSKQTLVTALLDIQAHPWPPVLSRSRPLAAAIHAFGQLIRQPHFSLIGLAQHSAARLLASPKALPSRQLGYHSRHIGI